MLKNSENLKPYNYSDACMFYLGAILVTLLCQGVAGIVSASLAKLYPNIASSGDFNTAFMIVIQVANAAFIYFYTRLKRKKFDFTFVKRDGDSKGVTPAVIAIPVVCAAALMAGMYLPTVWYGYLLRVMGLPDSFGNVQLDTASSIVMIVIASVALAPLMEETIYRGVLLHGLAREKREFTAVMLSALAFMLMHMNPRQVCFQLSLGIVSAFLALRSKRLLPSVILHASANAIALVMQLTPLDAALSGCVVWLTENIAAAVFITLGLFAAGGGVLFALVHFGFRSPDTVQPASAEGTTAGDGDGDAARVEEAYKQMADRDGTVKYWIGIGICGLMLIVNLISGIVS